MITYRINVHVGYSMILGTCMNANNNIRYGIMLVSDIENIAAQGPNPTSFKIFDESL
jgi:hypothetical protein